ncbi:MAG: hypothetical protein ACLQSR_00415 [Limisphaerales bacterium]
MVFVIRPIFVYYFHFDSSWIYIGFQPPEAVMIKTLAITSVALIVFVGMNLAVGRSRVAFPAETGASFSWLQRRALVVTTCLLLPLMAYSIRESTGGGVTGERAANGVYILTNSTGYITDAQFMIAPLLCAWLLMTRFHWLNFAPVIIYVGYRSWCGWSRFTIITFFLAVVLAYCWYHRKKWIPFLAIVLAIPILLLFNTLGHNRGYLQNRLKGIDVQAVQLGAGMSRLDKFRTRADTQDFANFDYLTFLVALVPERTHTYTYGVQYLQLFTEPIPRILWKGKPTGAPVGTFNINAFGNFTGLTFSLPGDGWCSGGWVGLAITMGIAGAILGFFHRWFWGNVNNPMAAIFYCTAMAMLIQWFRDGGISIAKFMLWSWLPLLIWLGLTWLLGGTLVPVKLFTLRAGDHMRLVQTKREGTRTN